MKWLEELGSCHREKSRWRLTVLCYNPRIQGIQVFAILSRLSILDSRNDNLPVPLQLRGSALRGKRFA